MACAVLGRFGGAALAMVVMASFAIGSAAAMGEVTPCSPAGLAALPEARQKDVLELQRNVEAGPLFQSLQRWRTQKSGCSMTVVGDNVVFFYSFADHVTLEAKNNSSIEYSEQTVHVRGMRADRALGLLKKSELDAMGAGGCGIDWISLRLLLLLLGGRACSRGALAIARLGWFIGGSWWWGWC